MLDGAPTRLVFHVQRGFVKGRPFLDNILDAEFVIEAALTIGPRHATTVLFDIVAVLPSVEMEWLLLALGRQGLPQRVLRLARGLLENLRPGSSLEAP